MKKYFIGAFFAIAPLTLEAASFSCDVNLTDVLLYKNGAVNIRHTGRSDYTYICNLNAEWKDVSITTCAMWASMLLNFKENNQKASFYYRTTAEYNSCSSLPVYSDSPSPTYIGAVN